MLESDNRIVVLTVEKEQYSPGIFGNDKEYKGTLLRVWPSFVIVGGIDLGMLLWSSTTSTVFILSPMSFHHPCLWLLYRRQRTAH